MIKAGGLEFGCLCHDSRWDKTRSVLWACLMFCQKDHPVIRHRSENQCSLSMEQLYFQVPLPVPSIVWRRRAPRWWNARDQFVSSGWATTSCLAWLFRKALSQSVLSPAPSWAVYRCCLAGPPFPRRGRGRYVAAGRGGQGPGGSLRGTGSARNWGCAVAGAGFQASGPQGHSAWVNGTHRHRLQT